MARIKSRKTRATTDEEETFAEEKNFKGNAFEKLVHLVYYKIKDVRKMATIVILVVTLVIIGLASYSAINHGNENDALYAFEKIRSGFIEIEEQKGNKDRIHKIYINKIHKFKYKYYNTKAANISNLWLANFYQNIGMYDKAYKYSREYADSFRNKFLKAYFLQSSATYLEESGQDEKAREIYKTIDTYLPRANQKDNDIFSVNLYQLGRLDEKAGKREDAIVLYEKAIENLSKNKSNTELKKLIRSRLLYAKNVKKTSN